MPVAPWWARFIVTLGLLALATRLLISRDQLGVAGAIVGYVGAHWLPSASLPIIETKEPPHG